MGYGETCHPGSLPVFSVGSEKEAKMLITMACELSMNNEYIARELANSQTLENLEKFSSRLDFWHDKIVEAGRCDCSDRAKLKKKINK